MMHKKPGYILFVTFSMLALCTTLVSLFMVKGFMHRKLAIALCEQEKMNQFVLSTPALAQSFLSFSALDLQGQSQASSNQLNEPAGLDDLSRKILEKVLPVVNKTQKFSMEEVAKDFPVVINLTFFCESGKININGLYDVANKKFYDEGVAGKDQKVFATWLFNKIAKITEQPSLLQPFIEHVQQRTVPFNDVTELLAIKEFSACFSQTIFYTSRKPDSKLDTKNQKLFLTDIFTVASESDTIQPWLLSPSVCVLLDIAQKGNEQDESEKKEEKKTDLSSFKQQADWQKDWDASMKPLYDISFDAIPEPVRSMFSKQFSAQVFSMLATVSRKADEGESNIARGVFAILKQKKLPDNSITYDVIRIYQV